MKILLRVAFVDQTGDESGGAQESFLLLLQHLPEDIDPRVLLFKDGAYAARVRALGISVTIIPVDGTLQSATRESMALRHAWHLPAAILHYANYFRKEKIEIVYTHTIKAHFIAAPAARLAGIPCVMHLRDILQGGGRRALQLVGRTCARQRIAISKTVARAYDFPDTTVVLNPVELQEYAKLPPRQEARAQLGLPPGAVIAGIVGRINRWKGHDAFLRIAAAVRHPDAHFVIAGSPIFRDEDFLPELHNLVRDLHLTDRVSFIPWARDARTVYAALDVLCNCSQNEPFGRTVIEAAAGGVPSICFADAGVSEELTDGLNGAVISTGNEAAFANALQTLLSDAYKREAMGAAARSFASRFSADTHAEAVARVLKRAVA